MPRMDPPGGHGATVVIGIGKPPAGGRMDPPGSPKPGDKQPGQKATDEEAQAVMHDAHCIDCKNWHEDTGECDEVAGVWDPQDACRVYFEPMNSGEPDQDEQGGPSDMDQDDQQGAAQ